MNSVWRGAGLDAWRWQHSNHVDVGRTYWQKRDVTACRRMWRRRSLAEREDEPFQLHQRGMMFHGFLAGRCSYVAKFVSCQKISVVAVNNVRVLWQNNWSEYLYDLPKLHVPVRTLWSSNSWLFSSSRTRTVIASRAFKHSSVFI